MNGKAHKFTKAKKNATRLCMLPTGVMFLLSAAFGAAVGLVGLALLTSGIYEGRYKAVALGVIITVVGFAIMLIGLARYGD